MADRLVFVSCGQRTCGEKSLGRRIKAVIDATPGYEAYYAEAVQDLSGLSDHVFDALRRCSCAVIVLHDRGRVRFDDGSEAVRGSVWINQEIAILAYRQFFETRRIPILAFKEPSVSLEGAMSAFILNPRLMHDEHYLLSELKDWLQESALTGPASNLDTFDSKWSSLTREGKLILAGLVAEGGIRVKETAIERFLRDHAALEPQHIHLSFLTGRSDLSSKGLVEIHPDVYSGNEMSLHPTWEWDVRHAVSTLELDV